MASLFEPDPGTLPDGQALVEVAVDAPAGPGQRTYTYAVPLPFRSAKATILSASFSPLA